jgi:hypothetical protein
MQVFFLLYQFLPFFIDFEHQSCSVVFFMHFTKFVLEALHHQHKREKELNHDSHLNKRQRMLQKEHRYEQSSITGK